MNSFIAFLSVVGFAAVVLASPFIPTKTGSATPELFWFMNDRGVVVPALLHGKNPQPSTRAIEDDVQFHLYNSKTPGSSVEITPGCASCLSSLVPGAPVVILMHGFSSDHLGGFGDGLRANFAQAPETMNLIFINWSKLAAAPWYETAANNVRPVGEYTARLVNFMVSSGAAPISSFAFAGHSLGSHGANYVTANLANGAKLPVVHALDPALPLFGVLPDSERIDPADADFVNVIHSAAGTLLDGGLAFTEPRGHADFYPNNGKNQPGCGVDYFGACSHSRAHEYFGESVHRRTSFSACKCPSWETLTGCDCSQASMMGWATPPTTRGYFHLGTRGASPFGLG